MLRLYAGGIPVSADQLIAVMKRPAFLIVHNFPEPDQRITGSDVQKYSVPVRCKCQGYFVDGLIRLYSVLAQNLIETSGQIFIFQICIGNWKMIGFKCDRNAVGIPYTYCFNNIISVFQVQVAAVSVVCRFFADADDFGPCADPFFPA